MRFARSPLLALVLVTTTFILSACRYDSEKNMTQSQAQPLPQKADGLHFIEVPKDYLDPNNRQTIKIAYSIHPATDRLNYLGILMFNFGGPGSDGIQSLQDNLDHLSPEILQRFDLVAVDPRGTGQSAFANCELKKNCDQVAAYLGSMSVIEDMERVRQALGVDTFSFFGYSYGTRLGALYAKYYGHHLRALVLDSPIDPLQTDLRDIAQDEVNNDAAIVRYLFAGDINNSYDRLVLLNQERPESPQLKAVKYLVSHVSENLWDAVYKQATQNWLQDPNDPARWQQLESFNQVMVKQGLPDLLDYQQTDEPKDYDSLFKSITCTDQAPQLTIPVDKKITDPDGLFDLTDAPNFCLNAPFDSERALKPVTAQDLAQNIPQTLTQVLIIAGKHDTNTPYKGALSMQRVFGKRARFVTLDGIAAHTFSYSNISAELDAFTTHYLLKPSQPINDIEFNLGQEHQS